MKNQSGILLILHSNHSFYESLYRVFSICSNVTKNMIHPQIEIHYMKQFSTLHSAASVWENDKSTMTPISPTPTSSSPLLLSQTLPSALLTLSCSLIKPLQVIQGTLYLSKDSLTFIVDPELKKEREEKIKQLDKKIEEGRKGENKWTLLDELKNEIWEIRTLQAEEFRLYQVFSIYDLNKHSSVILLLNYSSRMVILSFYPSYQLKREINSIQFFDHLNYLS